MKSRQVLILLVALIFPSCIFIFLKIFGKNRFDVQPMFANEVPAISSECSVDYRLPYQVADSVLQRIGMGENRVAYIYFGDEGAERLFARVDERYENDPVTSTRLDPEENSFIRKCIFLLEEPFDVVLVDSNGVIRGQYNAHDRDEIDRLITEIAVLIEKY